MSLVPRNSLFDFDSFFEPGVLSSMWPSSQSEHNFMATFSPKVDITERKESYEIAVDLPGLKKDDIHINLDNGILSIQAETHQENKEEKDGKLIRQERRFGTFYRSFDIGSRAQESDISATFLDGVLNVTIPKLSETQKETKRISIG